MRVLFLITDKGWSGRARAFVLAARGLGERGHDVVLACESECAVQVRVAESQLPVVSLKPDASAAGDTLALRRAVRDGDVDVVFVHSERELLIASSAVRLGRRAGAVIRRIPPFEVAAGGRGARLATKLAPTGVLFSTTEDQQASDGASHRLPSAVAPLAIDTRQHDAVNAIARSELGAPQDSTIIVCVNDGTDTQTALIALRTVALLAGRHPHLHLIVTGAAPLDDLRMHGASLGINSMVSYLGESRDELALLKSADLGWIAAHGDAAAFAALDFMAFGVPLICERTTLMQHYVADGIGGVLLPRADASTTAAAVSAFLSKREQRTAMGNAGRARLTRLFPYDAMIAGFESALNSANRTPAGIA